MKKTLFLFTLLLAPLAAFADSANKMTMVTYFPVPYVAYSQVDVTKQMDIGLTSACQMNLGCTADEGFSTGKSLRVNTALNIAGGKLDLNDAPAIDGDTVLIGSGNGVADFDFNTNLRVANYKQGYTMQADNMYLSELNLFGYKFPACSGETMSWQKLKLKNKEEVYLVCGEAEMQPVQTCSDATYKASHKKECCPSAPQTDTVCWTYWWDGDTSAGDEESGCQVEYDRGTCNYECNADTLGKSCQIDECSGGTAVWGMYTCTREKNGW